MSTVKESETETEINLSIVGYSTVEHSGDEDGIMQQVEDLIGLKASDEEFNFTVKNSVCSIHREEELSYDEYRVNAK